MISKKISHLSTSLAASIMAVFLIGSAIQPPQMLDNSINSQPTVISTSPSDGEMDVSRNIVIEITFSESMDSTSMENYTFSLTQGAENVAGTIEYSDETLMFTSSSNLKAETIYTAKLTTNDDYTDVEFNEEPTETDYPVQNGKEWTFTTGGNNETVGTVNLGSAEGYVILAQSSIHNDTNSEITGKKGFDPNFENSEENLKAYWIENEDMEKETVPRDTTINKNMDQEYEDKVSDSESENLNEAFKDMKTAYNDAEERTMVDFIDYGFTHSDNQEKSINNNNNDVDEYELYPMDAQSLGEEEDYNGDSKMAQIPNTFSITLDPGIYMWNESVEISTNITLSGTADDVWIFQINEDLLVNRDVQVTLRNGALAENIFWQVAGDVSLGESSHFEGVILSLSGITMKNGATLNGRMLTQTDITLDENTIKEPVMRTTSQRNTLKK